MVDKKWKATINKEKLMWKRFYTRIETYNRKSERRKL